MTRLDDIKFACHCAALQAIDHTLNEQLDMERAYWIQDTVLPDLLPAIDRAIEHAMRQVYDLMPESLNVTPADVERTRKQMAQSLAALEKLK